MRLEHAQTKTRGKRLTSLPLLYSTITIQSINFLYNLKIKKERRKTFGCSLHCTLPEYLPLCLLACALEDTSCHLSVG